MAVTDATSDIKIRFDGTPKEEPHRYYIGGFENLIVTDTAEFSCGFSVLVDACGEDERGPFVIILSIGPGKIRIPQLIGMASTARVVPWVDNEDIANSIGLT